MINHEFISQRHVSCDAANNERVCCLPLENNHATRQDTTFLPSSGSPEGCRMMEPSGDAGRCRRGRHSSGAARVFESWKVDVAQIVQVSFVCR